MFVNVGVAVKVGVLVGVLVAAGVSVGVLVGVLVGVDVLVGVGGVVPNALRMTAPFAARDETTTLPPLTV